MPYTRRNFLAIGGLTALAALTASPVFGQKSIDFNSHLPQDIFGDPLYHLTAEDFKNLVGSDFWMVKGETTAETVLIEVKSPQSSGKALKAVGTSTDCFSLVFAPKESGVVVEQSIYKVMHRTLGSFEMFFVPGKTPDGSPLLIAVINRI